jgi:excisionase family DNA binding protein
MTSSSAGKDGDLSEPKAHILRMKQLMTPEDLAKALQVSVSTIYRWVHFECVPHIKLGHAVRFDETEIERWVRKQRKDPRNQPPRERQSAGNSQK